jgi:uncharacterized coiled-coil protein SlyX
MLTMLDQVRSNLDEMALRVSACDTLIADQQRTIAALSIRLASRDQEVDALRAGNRVLLAIVDLLKSDPTRVIS